MLLPRSPTPTQLARWRILRAFCQQARGTVINRPNSGSSNFSKIVQLIMFQRKGIPFPNAILTSHAETLKVWEHGRGDLVFKSGSSLRSIVAQFDDQARSRLALLERCPTLFQERVKGVDVRVHVVGNNCHAEQIDSIVVDYRYAPKGTSKFKPIELPNQVTSDCIATTAAAGLHFAGIDFKVDGEGKYWMLEVNPMPGYDGYDRRLEGRICTCSLVEMLESEKSLWKSGRLRAVH